MNISRASELLNEDSGTVIRNCKSGKYTAKKIETKKGRYGFVWDVDDSFVISLASARRKDISNSIVSTSLEPSTMVDPENREIIVNTTKAISKKEAERIIKQEEAIRRQRENLIEDGKIIVADVVVESVGMYYSQLLQAFDSFIDILSIEESWSPEKTKKVLSRLKACVHECWDRTKSKVIECQRSTKNLINEAQNGTK